MLKNLNELKLDYTIQLDEDRMKNIENILEENEELFLDFYNYEKIKNNNITSDNNLVMKKLEQMADYLIRSYNLSEKKLKEKNKKEKNIETVYYEEDKNNKLKSNYRLPKKQTVTFEELDELEKVAPNIKDYYAFYQKCCNVLSQKNYNYFWKYFSKAKHQLMDDMCLYKDSALGVWGYNIKPTNETSKIDWDIVDLNDYNTILYFIKNGYEIKNMNDNLHDIYIDFENILYKIQYTKSEKIILEMLYKGYKYKEIANNCGLKESNFKVRVLPRLIKKIQNNNNFLQLIN